MPALTLPIAWLPRAHFHQNQSRRSSALTTSSCNPHSPTPSPTTSPRLFAVKPATEETLKAEDILPQEKETDAQCWERMLSLQQQYHCYNSARLEAAVEALERGVRLEEVPIPSRLCLDLLNESLRDWVIAMRGGFVC
ncbi:hypothetical protein B0J14DRAFT_563592 [Halenospora varia]|nr:hypothetical protein B0J14DRAFT_563592 [Halenospora varia]